MEEMNEVQELSHAVERRCATVREDGEPCRGTPALGETYCHAHARYRDAARSTIITVPLMEDEAAIAFVRSQTVRALAQGSIPPANANVMLRGCRDAERRLDRRLDVQRVALRYAALAAKIGVETARSLMGEFLQGSELRAQSTVGGERSAVGDQRSESGRAEVNAEVISDQRSVISEGETAPEEAEVVMHQSVFPEVKEEWDRALARTEAKIGEMVYPRPRESWHQMMERKKAREAAMAAAV